MFIFSTGSLTVFLSFNDLIFNKTILFYFIEILCAKTKVKFSAFLNPKAIEYVGGFHSFYAHLSKTLVNVGDLVRMGKHIACVENSGLTTCYHLHYEIRKGNSFLNPTEWCWCLLDFSLKQKCREECV